MIIAITKENADYVNYGIADYYVSNEDFNQLLSDANLRTQILDQLRTKSVTIGNLGTPDDGVYREVEKFKGGNEVLTSNNTIFGFYEKIKDREGL